MAKALAAELNYVFVDSGAMYKAITLYFIRNHIACNNSEEVIKALENIILEFSAFAGEEQSSRQGHFSPSPSQNRA